MITKKALEAHSVKKTMIDILRKGNQELFHSSMIAWLLDPQAEHGFGTRFLEQFAGKFADKGYTELQTELEAAAPKSVRTEVPSTGSRYDIEIRFENTSFVVENKTKSVGETSQLQQYDRNDVVPIALGLCDVSFSEQLGYPFILYQDVLDILRGIAKPDNEFRTLIEHYQAFLDRELNILDLIVECYEQGNRDARERLLSLVDASAYTENDRRFLSLFLVEKFRRERLEERQQWSGAKWTTNKNMSSGVWLSSHDKLPDSYSFDRPVADLCQDPNTKLWFHLELKKNLFKPDNGRDKVGQLQLRCENKNRYENKKIENKQLMNNFKAAYKDGNEQYLIGKTPQERWETFYLVRRDLSEEDLTFDQLEEEMTNFHAEFGSFSP